jgi:hypothetical protein
LGPGRKARSGRKADISLAADRADRFKAAKDEALGAKGISAETSKHYYVYGASVDL